MNKHFVDVSNKSFSQIKMTLSVNAPPSPLPEEAPQERSRSPGGSPTLGSGGCARESHLHRAVAAAVPTLGPRRDRAVGLEWRPGVHLTVVSSPSGSPTEGAPVGRCWAHSKGTGWPHARGRLPGDRPHHSAPHCGRRKAEATLALAAWLGMQLS